MEIENKQDHSLLPNDYFVIVSDPENLCRKFKKMPDVVSFTFSPNADMLKGELVEDGSLINTEDLKVVRVDGNIVSCYYRQWLTNLWWPHHIDIDMSKVDYKRIVCNW